MDEVEIRKQTTACLVERYLDLEEFSRTKQITFLNNFAETGVEVENMRNIVNEKLLIFKELKKRAMSEIADNQVRAELTEARMRREFGR